LTRLQRASEGSRKSTRSGRYNIVQGGSVRLQDRLRNLVMLRNGAVHSEQDRLIFRRKIRSAHRALHALDANMRPINHFGHYCWIVS